jgi:hypothetical protein
VRRARLILLILIILPGFLAGYFFVTRERVTPQERLQQARAALQQAPSLKPNRWHKWSPNKTHRSATR